MLCANDKSRLRPGVRVEIGNEKEVDILHGDPFEPVFHILEQIQVSTIIHRVLNST